MKIVFPKFSRPSIPSFICAILLGCAANVGAQHVHLNAGAASIEQDAPLYFVNGADYVTNAGYDVYLTLTNAGSFSNLYQGSGVTFTALASTPDNGGVPGNGHAAEGSFLQLEFVSLDGPAGGEFGVWMQDAGNPAASSPLFSLAVGATNGTNLLTLSESDGSPGSDPYGHIHGRAFAVNQPGLYTLGCRLVDTSTNGTGGGPIHTASDLYYFYFQAGLTISSFERRSNGVAIAFATALGKNYYVEAATNLGAADWTAFAGPFTGDNHLHAAATNSAAPTLFIRVRAE